MTKGPSTNGDIKSDSLALNNQTTMPGATIGTNESAKSKSRAPSNVQQQQFPKEMEIFIKSDSLALNATQTTTSMQGTVGTDSGRQASKEVTFGTTKTMPPSLLPFQMKSSLNPDKSDSLALNAFKTPIGATIGKASDSTKSQLGKSNLEQTPPRPSQ